MHRVSNDPNLETSRLLYLTNTSSCTSLYIIMHLTAPPAPRTSWSPSTSSRSSAA